MRRVSKRIAVAALVGVIAAIAWMVADSPRPSSEGGDERHPRVTAQSERNEIELDEVGAAGGAESTSRSIDAAGAGEENGHEAYATFLLPMSQDDLDVRCFAMRDDGAIEPVSLDVTVSSKVVSVGFATPSMRPAPEANFLFVIGGDDLSLVPVLISHGEVDVKLASQLLTFVDLRDSWIHPVEVATELDTVEQVIVLVELHAVTIAIDPRFPNANDRVHGSTRVYGSVAGAVRWLGADRMRENFLFERPWPDKSVHLPRGSSCTGQLVGGLAYDRFRVGASWQVDSLERDKYVTAEIEGACVVTLHAVDADGAAVEAIVVEQGPHELWSGEATGTFVAQQGADLRISAEGLLPKTVPVPNDVVAELDVELAPADAAVTVQVLTDEPDADLSHVKVHARLTVDGDPNVRGVYSVCERGTATVPMPQGATGTLRARSTSGYFSPDEIRVVSGDGVHFHYIPYRTVLIDVEWDHDVEPSWPIRMRVQLGDWGRMTGQSSALTNNVENADQLPVELSLPADRFLVNVFTQRDSELWGHKEIDASHHENRHVITMRSVDWIEYTLENDAETNDIRAGTVLSSLPQLQRLGGIVEHAPASERRALSRRVSRGSLSAPLHEDNAGKRVFKFPRRFTHAKLVTRDGRFFRLSLDRNSRVAFASHAHGGTIAGVVFDKDGNELDGTQHEVQVAVRSAMIENQMTAVSNHDFRVPVSEDGTFEIGPLPPGRYQVRPLATYMRELEVDGHRTEMPVQSRGDAIEVKVTQGKLEVRLEINRFDE